jgi:hypothetical protein
MPLQPLGATERIRRLRETTLAIYRANNTNTTFAENATLIAAQLGATGYIRQNASGSLTEEPCCVPCEQDTGVTWNSPVALTMSYDESTSTYSYSGPVATITSCLPVQILVEALPFIENCAPEISGSNVEVRMNKQGNTWIYTLGSLSVGEQSTGTYTQGIGFVFTLPDGSTRSASRTITFVLPPCV